MIPQRSEGVEGEMTKRGGIWRKFGKQEEELHGTRCCFSSSASVIQQNRAAGSSG